MMPGHPPGEQLPAQTPPPSVTGAAAWPHVTAELLVGTDSRYEMIGKPQQPLATDKVHATRTMNDASLDCWQSETRTTITRPTFRGDEPPLHHQIGQVCVRLNLIGKVCPKLAKQRLVPAIRKQAAGLGDFVEERIGTIRCR